jgi:hypothetical protein
MHIRTLPQGEPTKAREVFQKGESKARSFGDAGFFQVPYLVLLLLSSGPTPLSPFFISSFSYSYSHSYYSSSSRPTFSCFTSSNCFLSLSSYTTTCLSSTPHRLIHTHTRTRILPISHGRCLSFGSTPAPTPRLPRYL